MSRQQWPHTVVYQISAVFISQSPSEKQTCRYAIAIFRPFWESLAMDILSFLGTRMCCGWIFGIKLQLHNSMEWKRRIISTKQTKRTEPVWNYVSECYGHLMSSFICQPFPTTFSENIFFHFQLICEIFHHKYIIYNWHCNLECQT